MQWLGETGRLFHQLTVLFVFEQSANLRPLPPHTLDDQRSPTPRSFKAAAIWRSDFAAAACLTSPRGPTRPGVNCLYHLLGHWLNLAKGTARPRHSAATI